MNKITLTIDDQVVQVENGATVLEAARRAGIDIPTLCYHPDLSLAGSCRVCMVEDLETSRLLASCVTPAADGMRISTAAPLLAEQGNSTSNCSSPITPTIVLAATAAAAANFRGWRRIWVLTAGRSTGLPVKTETAPCGARLFSETGSQQVHSLRALCQGLWGNPGCDGVGFCRARL